MSKMGLNSKYRLVFPFCVLRKTFLRPFFAYFSYSEYAWIIPIFKMIFIFGSVIFSEFYLLSVYSRILRLVTALEKEEFKDWATSLSSEIILSFCLNVICSLYTILSKRSGFTDFQKMLLSLTFSSQDFHIYKVVYVIVWYILLLSLLAIWL